MHFDPGRYLSPKRQIQIIGAVRIFAPVDRLWYEIAPNTDQHNRSIKRYSSVGFRKPIADACFCLDKSRRARVILDFRSKLTNEDSQILGIVAVRRPPYGRQDLRVRDNATGVARQDGEEVVFLWRQMHDLVTSRNDAPIEVDLQRADVQDRFQTRWPCRMTKRCAQASQQLADAERLLDIIIRPEVEGLDFFCLPVSRRKNDDRNFRKGPQITQRFLPVAVGKPKIK